MKSRSKRVVKKASKKIRKAAKKAIKKIARKGSVVKKRAAKRITK